MGESLGYRLKSGRAGVDTNPFGSTMWTVDFTPDDLAIKDIFEVYYISIQGPTGSDMKLYLDTIFRDYVTPADINSWDPNQPMVVMPGQTIYFYWNSAQTPAPTVSIFCRKTSPV